jgi:DNA-binding CsgD family transcriptional regulator
MGNRLTIDPRTELRDWLRGPARDAIPHRAALVLHGSAHALGFTIEEKICVDLPDAYLAGLCDAKGHLQGPLLGKWMHTRATQYFDRADAGDVDSRWLRNLRAHGFENCALFGKVDPSTRRVVLILLYDLPAGRGAPEADVCATLLDALGSILARERRALAPLPRLGSVQRMTPAELEVLKWVRAGKTNYEIGVILGRSRFTVKTHIQRMLAKTGLDNRAQLADFARQSESPSAFSRAAWSLGTACASAPPNSESG